MSDVRHFVHTVRVAPRSDVVVLLTLLRAHRRLRHGRGHRGRRRARGAALHEAHVGAHELPRPRRPSRRRTRPQVVPAGRGGLRDCRAALLRRRAAGDGRHRGRWRRRACRRPRAGHGAGHRRDGLVALESALRQSPRREEARRHRRSAARAATRSSRRPTSRSRTSTCSSPTRSKRASSSRATCCCFLRRSPRRRPHRPARLEGLFTNGPTRGA